MEHSLQTDNTKLTLINGRLNQTAQPVAQVETEAVEDIIARLPQVLQTTLDMDKLIQLFHQQIKQVLPYDSLLYQHSEVSCTVQFGNSTHHNCHYRLDIDGLWLGNLTLSRRQKFSHDDIILLENLLCKLVYPLRNCLLYRRALNSSLQDPLTGLSNRGAFDTSLRREIDLSRRQHSPLALIVLDIDFFKDINDAYGHSSGDRALTVLAMSIVNNMRGSDMAFRYGGEEFTLLLSNTDLEAARLVAERIRVAASQLSCNDGKRTFGYTISLGVAQLNDEDNGYSLFDRADKALYQAKKNGRNQTVCADNPVISKHH